MNVLMCRLFMLTLNFLVLTMKNVNSLNEVIIEKKLKSSGTFNFSLLSNQSSNTEPHGELPKSAFTTQLSSRPHSSQTPFVAANNETSIQIQTSPPKVRASEDQ